MKHFKKIFLIGLPFLLAACSSDDLSEPNPDSMKDNQVLEFKIKGLGFKIENEEASLSAVDAAMTDVAIPSQVTHNSKIYDVTNIEASAFKNISNLKSLTVPSTLKVINGEAFANTVVENLYIEDIASWCGIKFGKQIVKNTYYESVEYSPKGNPIGPETSVYINGNMITENLEIPVNVSTYAFYDLNISGSIIFKEGVERIGGYAFYNCGFDSATFPESLSSIGACAFNGASISRINISSLESWLNINKVYIEEKFADGIYTTYGMAFDSNYTLYVNDKPLENIIIPKGTTEIKPFAFKHCLMKSINIPSSVNYIGLEAFGSCHNLENLEIESSGEPMEIRDKAFIACSSLKNIDLPGRCQFNYGTICSGVFSFCENLEIVTLNEGIEYLPKNCFLGCRTLKNINMPSSLKIVDEGCFDGCESIEKIVFPEGFEKLFGGILNCGSLQHISYPSTLSYIGDWYYACENLKSIDIQAINVPGHYGGIIPTVAENCILYVPTESVEAYKADEYWGQFQNIVGKDFVK